MSAALQPEFKDYVATANTYVGDVLDLRVPACKWVKLACQRQEEDLAESVNNPDFPFYYEPRLAWDVCDFVEKLPHVEGKWATPTITLEPWQIFILTTIFGWRKKEDGNRRFTKVYIEVARKNAKSTLVAAVSLYCFCCEDEPAPYIFIGATTGAQAQKVFHPCKVMVDKTPDLREAFGVKTWARAITEPGGGYIQTINSKGSTQDGHNPHLGVLDELHAHKDRALYDVIDSAFGARKNPLMWMITTAGFDTTSVCYEQRTFLTKVLENTVQAEHYFGIIYTLDEGDDIFDEGVWIKSNPNLDVSVQRASLRSAATEAAEQPGKVGEFSTKRMNVWTSAKVAHINVQKWKACNGPVDLDALRAVPCWGGLDLGSTSDLTSFRLVWRVDGKLYTWGKRYLPEAAVQPRTQKNSVPYARWVHQGFITVTPGDVTDYEWVERDVRWALSEFKVQAIGFDRWNAQDLSNRLTKDKAPLVEVRQGVASLNGPVKELDRCYLQGLLHHGGDEVLAWCASNVVMRPDANGNFAPDKSKSHEKIDDYVALLNAIAVMLNTPEKGRSVYETRGMAFA